MRVRGNERLQRTNTYGTQNASATTQAGHFLHRLMHTALSPPGSVLQLSHVASSKFAQFVDWHKVRYAQQSLEEVWRLQDSGSASAAQAFSILSSWQLSLLNCPLQLPVAVAKRSGWTKAPLMQKSSMVAWSAA